jgi:molecular chaperone HtpG
MIGQFGVGFYSAFMVADSVEVHSRSWHARTARAAVDQRWQERVLDRGGQRTGARGQSSCCTLKDDCTEYATESRG